MRRAARGGRRGRSAGRGGLPAALALVLAVAGVQIAGADLARGLRLGLLPPDSGETSSSATASALQRLRLGLATQEGIELVDLPPLPGGGTTPPRSAIVREIGRSAGLEALLFGRAVAGSGRLELLLLSGHSGRVLAQRAAALPAEGATEATQAEFYAALAGELAADLGVLASTAGSSAGGQTKPPASRPFFDLAQAVEGDAPLEIAAEEAELTAFAEGGRRVVFSQAVRVVRGDMLLRTDWLEARYGAGGGEPERLVARGQVRVTQGERSAKCDEAVYDRSLSLLTCRGRAELYDGCDVVRGAAIEFDLDDDRARVVGAASVTIGGRGGEPCDRSSE